jgi:probable F420-dependent oxidoreductase
MAVRIGIGLGLGGFPFETISEFRSWLDVCEDSPIDSIWQSDRVVSRDPALEPIALLSVIAGATRRLKFGTNAIVLPFRDPITFARQCATLDHLSDGRFLPAVGIGRGDAPEWEATGRSPKGRGDRANEALEVITRLWRAEGADFEGEYFSLKGATIAPRPKQQPMPLWLGGASQAAIRRTARYGNGWLAPLQSPEEAGVTVAAIRKESHRIGNPIPDDHYGATILFRIGDQTDPPDLGDRAGDGGGQAAREMRQRISRIQAMGEAGEVLARIREFRTQGITKFIAIPLARTAAEMIEQSRRLATEVIPHAND